MIPRYDDATLAGVVADDLTAGRGPPHYLSIFHDVRSSTPRRMAKLEIYPDHSGGYKFGPRPLRYDWSRKNLVGIKETDTETAKQWAIEALLLGYSAFVGRSKRDSGGRPGHAVIRTKAQARAPGNGIGGG